MIQIYKNNLANKPPLFGGVVTKQIKQDQKVKPNGMQFLEGEIIDEIENFFVDSAKFLDLKMPTNHQHIQIDYGEILYKDFEIKRLSFKGNYLISGTWNRHSLVREFEIGEPFYFQTLEDFQELSPETAPIEYLSLYRVREGILLNWNLYGETYNELIGHKTSKKYNRFVIKIIEDEPIGKAKHTPTNKMFSKQLDVSKNERVPAEKISYDLFGKYESITSNNELGLINFTFDKKKIASKVSKKLFNNSDYNPQSLIDSIRDYEIDKDDKVLPKIRKELIKEEVDDILSNSYSSIKRTMEQYLSITQDALISLLFLNLHGTYNDKIARKIVDDIRKRLNDLLDENWKQVRGYPKGHKRKKSPRKKTKLEKQEEKLKILSQYKEIRSNLADLLTDGERLLHKEDVTINILANHMNVNKKTISNRLKKMEHLITLDTNELVRKQKSSQPQLANSVFKAIKDKVYEEIMK